MSLPYKAEEKHDQDGYGRASNQRPYWMVESQDSSAKEYYHDGE
jgi:hypothetical protein